MRARFAAFALGDIEFLWRTLHPDHDDRRASEEPVRAALKLASRSLKFMRLRILDAEGPRVLFLAAVFEKGTDRSFLELSTFARDGDAWRYLSGVSRDARAAEEPVATTIDAFLRAGGDA
jgi:SEC-C motif-containing protein